MLNMMLYVLYYRLKCFKITIDAAFYHFITFHISNAIENSLRIFLWVFLLLIFSPLELLLGSMLDILHLFNITNETIEQLRIVVSDSGKTKENAKKEYEDYRRLIFEDEKN